MSLQMKIGSDGSSPWRTRGAFDPNANGSGGNLPMQSDCNVGPSVSIAPNDSFVVTGSFSYTGLNNGSHNVAPGDRLVYIGGTLSSPGSWTYVYEAYLYPAGNIRVISQLDTAFMQ